MRVIKMLGAALIGCAAFIGVGANAQQVPVSCTWATVSSEGPPSGATRYITQQCKDSGGNVIATRNFVWASVGGLQSCSMSTAPGISYTGDCLQPTAPSFYRSSVSSSSVQSSSAASSSSACTTPGLRVFGGCMNSYTPNMLSNPTYLGRCGTGCTLEKKELGFTSYCPAVGEGRSPEFGIFCK